MSEELEIQKLKQERDEILAKVEELDKLTACAESVNWPEVSRIIDSLKALLPKPERLRLWVNYCGADNTSYGYATEGAAHKAVPNAQRVRAAVPMIEVRPLPELPEMEEWEVVGSRGAIDAKAASKLNVIARDFAEAKEFVRLHNATVRAFKKWAEEVKKEVGDE